MSEVIEVDFFNSYILRKVVSVSRVDGGGTSNNSSIGVYPGKGLPGGMLPVTGATDEQKWRCFYIEEGRIRGGYNNVSTDQGVRAYLDEEYPLQQNRISTLIYSGVYNSRTGVNQTNVFSIGENITKSCNPVHGSIQKTYAEQTNLVVFQENRIHKALIDKDTIYTTESGTQTQAAATVIGQLTPYKGEYGISKNPESFAIYNYRKYFADRNRNSIMRLSNDGLTEVSMYGMRDYFRDRLAELNPEKQQQNIPVTYVSNGGVTETMVKVLFLSSGSGPYITPGMSLFRDGVKLPGYITFTKMDGVNTVIYYSEYFTNDLSSGTLTASYYTRAKVIGGWDIHSKNYVVSLQQNPSQVSTNSSSYKTLAFDEEINGWVSLFTYKPVQMFSMLNKFYSVGKKLTGAINNDSYLWEHYYNTTPDALNRGKFYDERKPSSVTFVLNQEPSTMKSFKTISYEGSNGWEVDSFVSGYTGYDPDPANPGQYIQDQDTTTNAPNPATISVLSYEEGLYTDPVTGQPLRAGFARKENRYVANLVSNSAARAGEVIFGADMTGIKGYFATVKIKTDDTTQLGGPKELWSSGSDYVISSY